MRRFVSARPAHAGLVGELRDEASEVDLRLLAGRGLEPHLERLGCVLRPDGGDERFTAV
jgi:hypothetical protein